MNKGLFIVLEGIDGSGKTTQAKLLAKHINGQYTFEPSEGAIGVAIRKVLGGDNVSFGGRYMLPYLFAADRAHHLHALDFREHVVMDRYIPSSLAYQSQTPEFPEVTDVYALNAKFRLPDLTIFVNVPVEIASARIEARGNTRDIYETREHITRITWQYQLTARFLRERGWRCEFVSGEGTPGEVFDRIISIVQPLLPTEKI